MKKITLISLVLFSVISLTSCNQDTEKASKSPNPRAMTENNISIINSRDWSTAKSWIYQLTNYKNDKLDEIAASSVDIVVIDLARDGVSNFFKLQEIKKLKATKKMVLSYFEIGAIEQYRPEWHQVPNDLKAGAVAGWPEEQYVKFWDERWWPIVKSRIDQSLAAGFDGAYLDMITTYQEIEGSGMSMEARARKMVDLIVRLSEYAKGKNPNFKIIPQNCPELYTWSFWEPKVNSKYIKVIDGIGLESPFYMAHDKKSTEPWCEEYRNNALEILKAGKIILAVDYAKHTKSITDAYEKQREMGFVPYVSIEALNQVCLEKHK